MTALVAIFMAMTAVAEDIETLNHQIYKNATITRAEPDGIVITYSAGIVKIPFTELSEEWRARYHYDKVAAEKYAAEIENQQAALYQQAQTIKAAEIAHTAELAAQAEAQRAENKRVAREKAKKIAEVESAIAERRLLIGMTTDECVRSWGSPDRINITTTAVGQRSQWIYPWATIYIENGLLAEIDNPEPKQP